MLFNEPKLLKYGEVFRFSSLEDGFSALQRAEIAEIALLAAERYQTAYCFSALQRAEIAEICDNTRSDRIQPSFSALQRAEIAEIARPAAAADRTGEFQCSSTSRNC